MVGWAQALLDGGMQSDHGLGHGVSGGVDVEATEDRSGTVGQHGQPPGIRTNAFRSGKPFKIRLFRAVKRDVTPGGLPKRATEIATIGIAGMGEQEYPAMPAASQALAQVRLGSQDRSQEHIKLQDRRGNFSFSIPARLKLEKLRDRYCKKPKLSLRVQAVNPNVLVLPGRCLRCRDGRAGFFLPGSAFHRYPCLVRLKVPPPW